jgi:hypothetical protein
MQPVNLRDALLAMHPFMLSTLIKQIILGGTILDASQNYKCTIDDF